MALLPRKSTEVDAGKHSRERPIYLGKVRADRYVEALRDPGVREVLARVTAERKRAHPS